jgi:hypothetical protein
MYIENIQTKKIMKINIKYIVTFISTILKQRRNESEWLSDRDKVIEDNNTTPDINPTYTPKLEDEPVLSPNPNIE